MKHLLYNQYILIIKFSVISSVINSYYKRFDCIFFISLYLKYCKIWGKKDKLTYVRGKIISMFIIENKIGYISLLIILNKLFTCK